MSSSIIATATATEAPSDSTPYPRPTRTRPTPMIVRGARLRRTKVAGSSRQRIIAPLIAISQPYARGVHPVVTKEDRDGREHLPVDDVRGVSRLKRLTLVVERDRTIRHRLSR
ncbi:hypothetical protein [Streptomyces sp. NPDC002994]|uniref:hypothetical protein n=1 Tax=Streptomyces sp. NPDC002994 TaxID=3154441 RepID=UPI0033A0AAFB